MAIDEKQFSKRAQALQPSATLAVSKKAKEMAAAGEDVINLGMGEPDFETPKPIAAAAVAAIQSGQTSFYTPVGGTLSLRKGIAQLAERLTGQELSAKQVTVTTGAKMALYALSQILVNPGDLVVAAKPYWVSYAEQVGLAGGRFEALGDDRFGKLTVAALNALDEKPKVILLNNPTNPSGVLYSKAELQAILDWAEAADCFLIVDEIYGRLVYNGAHFTSVLSLAQLNNRKLIVVDGVSKSYSMTGWRIGWALADEQIIAELNKVLGHMTSNPTAVAQAAAEAAVTGDQQMVESIRQVFEKRLNTTYAAIQELPGLTVSDKPEGAFYFFIKIEDELLKRLHLNSSADFAKVLLEEEKVALPAGEGFGKPGYLRLSYAKDQAAINEALKRIKRFITKD
ncbi:pyridoxal phosphate-dependent aminotransferase [Fructobacillus papyrifericola]|uniref:Aminotransferase n=1 Tax=Fructobacillus papyrifericola TaxID=2713172 RepID=A0ABS5QTN0_9LACO|nr:pyridoxal phosphate-dependent aminotransferase [Fructobacillus papyrifericola]MBS9335870.1 pyridoxal phosphate-dependent aminotransferase [Fructobacillus papyrifericola]